MAAGAWIFFDSWKLYVQDGTIDMNTDTIHAALLYTAATPNRSTWTVVADLTNEVATFGYARQTLTTPTFSEPTPGTRQFTGDSLVWTPSGGDWTGVRYVVLLDDTVASPVKPLICYSDLGTDTNVGDGVPLTIDPHATNGIYRLSGAES